MKWISISLFDLFSRCEEIGVLPRASGWIKANLLGALLTIITLMSAAGSTACCPVTCYVPPPPPIHDIETTPNPTNGADSVTVKAKAHLVPAAKGTYVKSALCFIAGDGRTSDTGKMLPVDGIFDSPYEGVSARLSVKDMNTGKVKVHVKITSNRKQTREETADLEITE